MSRRSNPAREESGASMPGAPGYHGSAQGEAVPAMGGGESAFAPIGGTLTDAERDAAIEHDERADVTPPAIFPPDPAALTAAVEKAWESLAHRKADEDLARERRIIGEENVSAAIDAKARSLGAGKFCTISGIVYRSVPPRKSRGKPEDPGAPWRLERVEVGE